MSDNDTLTLRRPDDWHVHLRDGDMLRAVLPYTARQFARAIVMPNLASPVTTASEAGEYRRRILDALPDDELCRGFLPLMTCYLTDNTDADELERGFVDGVFTAAKLYPANATTNSAAGVTDIANLDAALERMAGIGMPLLMHGEVTDPSVDVFDRETQFIKLVLDPMLGRFPGLKAVLEHITTMQAVSYVRSKQGALGATITAHHLMINRNALFEGGLRPHNYCLPIAKRESHRLALREAATSGEPWFFLGTDSAPHEIAAKEADCGCAGIFTAPAALELYAQVFDEEGAMDKLESFASVNGPTFYGLEVNEATVTLVRDAWDGPVESVGVKCFAPSGGLDWRIK
ncbi:MAG: dihydroorotase [Rhodospirillales bacterium]|nr:dihydroorotase [Rhodospirillales bacterium]